MAEKIVSPGVFTRENDLSFLPQGISQIGAAVVGPTEKGPAFVPTLVTSQAEYEQIFGTPKDYYTGYTVQNYLRDAGSVTVVRVAGVDGYQTLGGSGNGTFALKVTDSVNGSVPKILAILDNTETLVTASVAANDNGDLGDLYDLVVGGVTYAVNIDAQGAASIDKVFGTTPLSSKSKYTNIWFDLNDLSTAELAKTGITFTHHQMPPQRFSSSNESAYSFASTPFIKSQKFDGNNRYDLFKVHTLSHGEGENTRFKIQISNIKSSLSGSYGTFSLTVREFGDSDKRKVILESYNNLTLDYTSPNFIGRRIGDRTIAIASDGKITETGDYSNKSKYIRVEIKPEGFYPIEAVPFAFGAYTIPATFTGNDATAVMFPVVRYTTASLESTGSYSSGFEFGDNNSIASKNNLNYLKPIPFGAEVGSNTEFGLDNTKGVNGVGLSAAYTASANDIAKRNFCLPLQGGFNGVDPTINIQKHVTATNTISATNTQGFDCSTSTASGTKAYVKALNTLSNPDELDINLLVTPGIIRRDHRYVSTKAMDLCEAREDVFYIADFVGAEDSITEVVEEASLVDSNYTATYYPWVKTIDTITNRVIAVPPSTLLVGTYAQNDRLGAEWFAPAGLNRGGIQGAVQVMNRLTQSERDTLYEGKVNPIAAFPGQGISAFGQKTLQESSSALDRINVRRLLINLKKFVASTSRFLVFEQNTGQTRAKFLNTVNPYLESVQQRQGLYAFRVVMDETNNTPDVIDRNILQGSVFLQPAKTAEFIVIDFNILPTGATFSV
jgi:hypothetical protein